MHYHLRQPEVMPYCQVKIFRALNLSSDKPNSVLFRFAVGRDVNAAFCVCDGLGTEHNEGG